ncbi:MAG: UDP-N-acetylmuramoyl-L-alanine--D-glutamate ligase [Clostridia bacterium]|nr:UDP-N-acetylmuramoyl-L-alanine--D-glutamate ligase [Clostridia bacterium]
MCKVAQFKENIKGKNVGVIGIGISNRPLIKYLVAAGADVSAYDRKTEEQLGDIAHELKALGVKLILGENYLDNLSGDVIFKTPGMRYDNPAILKAEKQGSVITSEMEVFFEICPANTIAVTGSDGKTTTTTLIYTMLKEAGYTAHLGGNIGTPLMTKAEEMNVGDYAILELSSFQLHTMKKSPHIAVITNITPNHLDWHIDYQEYIDAKKNIMQYQNEEDILVVNAGNQETKKIGENACGKVRSFSSKTDALVHLNKDKIFYGDEEILDIKNIKIPGKHNIENYMTAIAAVYDLVDKDIINKVAREFGGVPHRIELVRTIDGVRYYNSSIDSSPNRTINTLNVFSEPVVLIAGGKDKGIPYDEIGAPIAEHVKTLILIGATSKVIDEAVKKTGKTVPTFFVNTYEEAVTKAKESATSGDVVLLSSASTSFDMFNNFEERGNLFKELVNKL